MTRMSTHFLRKFGDYGFVNFPKTKTTITETTPTAATATTNPLETAQCYKYQFKQLSQCVSLCSFVATSFAFGPFTHSIRKKNKKK